MNDDLAFGAAMASLATIFIGIIVLVFVVGYTNQKWQRLAVDKGAAKYVMDAKTGEVKWQWKEEINE